MASKLNDNFNPIKVGMHALMSMIFTVLVHPIFFLKYRFEKCTSSVLLHCSSICLHSLRTRGIHWFVLRNQVILANLDLPQNMEWKLSNFSSCISCKFSSKLWCQDNHFQITCEFSIRIITTNFSLTELSVCLLAFIWHEYFYLQYTT